MIFFLNCPLIEFGQIKQKIENGSCSRLSCVNQHDFKWMYDITYETAYIQLQFGSPKKFKIQNSYFAYLWTNGPQNSYSGKLVISDKYVKFIYFEKATKFWEIFPLLLTTVHTVKSKVKISQNFGWPSQNI